MKTHLQLIKTFRATVIDNTCSKDWFMPSSRPFFRTFYAAIVFSLSQQACADDTSKPTLTWLNINWQPAWINDGPLKGLGYAQTVERMLREGLTRYNHIERPVASVTIYPTLQNRDACFAASPYQGKDLQEDKKQGVIWSAPAYLYFYTGIIAKPDAVPGIQKHAADGYVNFSSLIQDNTIKGAFQDGRSYSRWLNPIFADPKRSKNLFKSSGETALTQSMFKLIDAGRVDYFVDYVIMLKYHRAATGVPSKYVYLPLEEHKNLLSMGSIACSDTPLGRAAIKDINEVLNTIRLLPEFRNANRRWLMPDGQEDVYWRKWETELLPLKK